MQAVQSAVQEVGFVQAPDSAAPDAQCSVRTFTLPRSGILPEGTHGEAMACQVRVVPMGSVAVLVYAWCAVQEGVLAFSRSNASCSLECSALSS